MNRILLIGRLGKDPEIRTTTTGKNYATFSLAVNKRIKSSDGSQDSDWFNVKVWGQKAEYVNNYLTKGRLVSVEGRMESRKYTDQQGMSREIWEVTADEVNGLDRPKEQAEQPQRTEEPSAGAYDPFGDD